MQNLHAFEDPKVAKQRGFDSDHAAGLCSKDADPSYQTFKNLPSPENWLLSFELGTTRWREALPTVPDKFLLVVGAGALVDPDIPEEKKI